MNTQLHAQSVRTYLLECENSVAYACRTADRQRHLHFQIEQSEPEEALVAVSFVEVIMEGAGCTADRQERFGKLRLRFDSDGHVQSAEEA